MEVLLIIIVVLIKFLTATDNFLHLNKTTTNPDTAPNPKHFTELQATVNNILAASSHKLCYTLITDDFYYHDIFTSQLFHNITERPVLISKIAINEDLQSPDYKTVNILLKSRELRCGVYLILLANGIQMERLLRFGEKHRLFNSNAFFVLLFDRRILTKSLLHIWRRYVNVVFLKERIVKTKHKHFRLQFELITTPFPLPLREIFVGKQLGYFKHGEFMSSSRKYQPLSEAVYQDKLGNLNGNQMRAVVVPHMPGVQRKSGGNNYTGVEVHIVEALGSAMNFTPTFYETDNVEVEKWGHQLPNLSFTGMLGEMVRDVADFALGDLYYTPYHLEILDLSYPYQIECLTFLTPEAFADNSWQTLILPLSWEMWLGGVLSGHFVACLLYFFSRFHLCLRQQQVSAENKRRRAVVLEGFRSMGSKLSECEKLRKMREAEIHVRDDIFDSFLGCLLYTYSMSVLVSLPRLPRGWSIRLLTGWFWLYCVLMTVSYKASLTAILANPTPKLTIDTLIELANSPGIECGAWGDQNQQLFTKALDPIGQKIGAKMQQVDDTDQAIGRVVEGNFAFFENIHILKEMRMRYEGDIKDSTQSQLHIMSECAVHMPLALGLAKNSPLKNRIDVLMQRLVESGLIAKWLRDAIERLESNIEDKPPEALMDIKKLYGAIVFLGIGYLLSLLGLIAELLHWRFVVTKHPMYDKYYKRKYYEYLKNQKFGIKIN